MPPSAHQDTVIALLPGELPDITAPRGTRLVFDLAAIELLDSRLIARLLAIVRAWRPVAACFHRPCPRVRVQLAQLGLDRIVPVLADGRS